MGRLWPYRTGAMQNVVYELRRITLPRTLVNKREVAAEGGREARVVWPAPARGR